MSRRVIFETTVDFDSAISDGFEAFLDGIETDYCKITKEDAVLSDITYEVVRVENGNIVLKVDAEAELLN